jgi:hypothetical protein
LKRLFGALAVGSIVFGAVLVSAANLSVDAGVIQVGQDSTLTCDADGVTVGWNARQDGVVTSIQVNGISADCTGKFLFVYVLNGAGDIIGTGGGLDAGTGGAPVTIQPTPLFSPDLYNAACDSSSCKVQLTPANNDVVGDGSHGVAGTSIEGIRIMIG